MKALGEMNEEQFRLWKIKHRLQTLKERYFRSVIARKEGLLVHFGDCNVHRPVEIYGTAPCNCGFNCDLARFTDSMKTKLNPKFWEEAAKEEPRGEPINEETLKEIEKLFNPSGKIIEIQCDDDEEEWAMIAEVFGQGYVDYVRRRMS